MTDELKPCPAPWCTDSWPGVRGCGDEHWVTCGWCGCSAPSCETQEGAIALWNTRSTSLSDEALVEAAKAVVIGARLPVGVSQRSSKVTILARDFHRLRGALQDHAIEAIASSDTTLITALREALESARSTFDRLTLIYPDPYGVVFLQASAEIGAIDRALSNQPGERG